MAKFTFKDLLQISTLDLSFRKAAAEERSIIRRDAQLFAGDEEVTELVELFQRRLFDTDFDVRAWKKLGKISRKAAGRFVAELGSLKEYLDKHRIRVAERLVRKTDAALSGTRSDVRPGPTSGERAWRWRRSSSAKRPSQ